MHQTVTRDTWRSLVDAIKTPRTHVVMQTQTMTRTADPHGYITTRSQTHTCPEPKSRTDAVSANPKSKTRTVVVKYRDRDTHMVFFHRPPQPLKKKTSSPKKTRPLINKERQQFARDHYQSLPTSSWISIIENYERHVTRQVSSALSQ